MLQLMAEECQPKIKSQRDLVGSLTQAYKIAQYVNAM